MVSARTFTGKGTPGGGYPSGLRTRYRQRRKRPAKAEAGNAKEVGALRPDSIDVMKQKMARDEGRTEYAG